MRLEIVYLDDFDPDKPLFAFFATRDIQPGEELCFSYTGSPGEGKAKLLQEEQKRKNASSRVRRSFYPLLPPLLLLRQH